VSGSDETIRELSSRASPDGGLGNDEPRPQDSARSEVGDSLLYPPTPEELLAHARLCWEAGLTVVPVRRSETHKGRPLHRWKKGGWLAHVLGGERIPWLEIEKVVTRMATRANGLAAIIPRGVVIADPDSPEAAEYAEEQGLPDTVRVASSRGFHSWYRHECSSYTGRHKAKDLDPRCDPRAAKLELLGPGNLAYVPPSKDKRWLKGPCPVAELTEAPAWIVGLMQRLGGTHATPAQSNCAPGRRGSTWILPLAHRAGDGDYDIAEWAKHIEGLEPVGPGEWLGFCPGHENPSAGHSKSFSVLLCRDGKLRGQDFGTCPDMALVTRRADGGRRISYMLIWRRFTRRVRPLEGMRAGFSRRYGQAYESLAALSLPEDEHKLWEAIISMARRNAWDMRHPICFTYRDVAEATGCEKVVRCNPDGRERVHLSNHGRAVVRLVGRAVARFPGDEHEQRWQVGAGFGNASRFLIPQAWIASRRVQMSGEAAADPGPQMVEEVPAAIRVA
jgi:hypothetical protein